MGMPLPHQKHIQFLSYMYGLVIGTMVLFSLLIPKTQDILLVNSTHTEFQDNLFRVITYLGDGVVFVPIIIVLLFVRFYDALAATALAALLAIITSVLKRLIYADAGRPITHIDNSLLYFVPGVEVHSHYSFPSGHTATIFGIIVFFSLLSGRKNVSVLLLIVGLLVGYSRMYLLQHFLIDVTVGAILGTVTALLIYSVFAHRKYAPWMDKNLHIRVRTGHQHTFNEKMFKH
ncbi:MAG TPA: phosphatase PAP2 family protein [Chryseolinea sp.]